MRACGYLGRVSVELVFDDGVPKELRKEVVLLEGVRRDEGNGKSEGVDVCIDVGTGAGEVATGPGVNADTMDWETSERRLEARFWLLENTSPPSLRPTFPQPPPATASDLAPGIDEADARGERLMRSVFWLGVSRDPAPSASSSEAVMLTAVTDAFFSGLNVP